MYSSILNWQTNVEKQMQIALPGQKILLNKVRTYQNSAGEVRQVTIIDIGTIAAANYVVKTLGQTVTVPILVTDTQAQARDKIITSLKANAVVYGSFVPEINSGTSLKLTARDSLGGISIPVTVSGGGAGFSINNASIAAATSLPIPFGGVIAVRAGDAEGTGRVPTLATDTPVAIALLTQTQEITIASAWSAREAVGGAEDGELYARLEDPAGVTFNGNLYYRHTADGAFTTMGLCSATAGTGKSQFTACKIKGYKATPIEDMWVVPVAIA